MSDHPAAADQPSDEQAATDQASRRRPGIPSPTSAATGRTYRDDEWDLLVSLPGRIVVAATSAEADTGRRTVAEGLAGLDAIAAGRYSASGLVRDVVSAIYDERATDAPAAEEFRDRVGGIAGVLDACQDAAGVLAARAARPDADAYRHWLESIAARVCMAARSGGWLGRRGRASAAERAFLADLGAAFDRAPGRA